MNEPDKLNLSDYFGAMVTVAVFLVGGLAAWGKSWVTGRRVAMREKFEALEERMTNMEKNLAKHDEMIAVMSETQKHTKELLEGIKSQLERAFILVPKRERD